MKRCTMYDVRCTIVSLLLMFSVSVFAQSNLTYELKVGTAEENKLLTDFPESYAGQKVNITIQTVPLTETDLDFVFVHEGPVNGFDSIFAYTDESAVVWTVWRNNKPIKNRAQRVMVGNAYSTFEAYLHEQGADTPVCRE